MLRHSTQLWPSVPVYFSNASSNSYQKCSKFITWNLLANFEPPMAHMDDLCTAEAYFYVFDNMWAFIDNYFDFKWNIANIFFSGFWVAHFVSCFFFRGQQLSDCVSTFNSRTSLRMTMKNDEKRRRNFCEFDDNETTRIGFNSSHPTQPSTKSYSKSLKSTQKWTFCKNCFRKFFFC